MLLMRDSLFVCVCALDSVLDCVALVEKECQKMFAGILDPIPKSEVYISGV